MKRLCFGTFATVLKNCMAKRVTQKKLCGAMLLSIAPTFVCGNSCKGCCKTAEARIVSRVCDAA